ncbi:MAG: DUF5989 family protein [Planctomycetaceae bacterium]
MTDEVRRQETERRDLRELVESPQPGLLAEFWLFLRENKKWWLLPLLLALLVLGLLVVLSGTGLAPFIYPFT